MVRCRKKKISRRQLVARKTNTFGFKNDPSTHGINIKCIRILNTKIILNVTKNSSGFDHIEHGLCEIILRYRFDHLMIVNPCMAPIEFKSNDSVFGKIWFTSSVRFPFTFQMWYCVNNGWYWPISSSNYKTYNDTVVSHQSFKMLSLCSHTITIYVHHAEEEEKKKNTNWREYDVYTQIFLFSTEMLKKKSQTHWIENSLSKMYTEKCHFKL